MNKAGVVSDTILFSFVAFGVFVWYQVFSGAPSKSSKVYFLDVGQGDAELVVFPGNIKVMTDAGPDNKVMTSLGKALPTGDHYIDLAIVSHPQLDHFNGYNFILDQYKVGAFIINGRSDTKTVYEWPQLLAKIKEKNIPLITLGAGDSITYASDTIDMLSPDKDFIQSGELNDTGFVELIKTPEFRTLLTADTGFNVEDYLVQNHFDLKADVLKIGHHGSKTSSGANFLAAVNPKVAAIEVGAKNMYGHPTKEALARLASTTVNIFRTDMNGTVEITAEEGKLKVLTEKQ